MSQTFELVNLIASDNEFLGQSTMRDSEKIQILYIEDDVGAARLFQKTMTRAGYQVDLARDGGEGLLMAQSKAYDVVTVDQRMPIYDGLEVIRQLAARGPLGPTIMVTANGDEKVAVEAMKLGASDYLVKDPGGGYLALLPTVIEQVLKKQRLIEEREQAMRALEQRNRNLALLNLVGQALTATLDLQQVIERLLQAAIEILEAEDSSHIRRGGRSAARVRRAVRRARWPSPGAPVPSGS